MLRSETLGADQCGTNTANRQGEIVCCGDCDPTTVARRGQQKILYNRKTVELGIAGLIQILRMLCHVRKFEPAQCPTLNENEIIVYVHSIQKFSFSSFLNAILLKINTAGTCAS